MLEPSRAYRILIAAGGTGGHVYPAIAIADALREARPDTEITFVGTKDHIEWKAVPKAGYPIRNIWISGFHRRLTLQNLLFPVKLITSIFQSFSIVKKTKPDLFLSCGGYVAGPAGWVCARKGIMLGIQEQNSFPGVTNRMLSKNADVIYTAFTQADAYFPNGKTVLTGNPTRKSLLHVNRNEAAENMGFDPNRTTILILGGSGGARTINEAMARHIQTLHDELGLQIIWQTGSRYINAMREKVNPVQYPRLILTDFLENMPAAYAASDLVISRAGASSCAELMLTGKPSVLIPSPHVAGDHQTKNAEALQTDGAAVVLADADAEAQLTHVISGLLKDDAQLQQMSDAISHLATPDAAADIARDLFARLDARFHGTKDDRPVSADTASFARTYSGSHSGMPANFKSNRSNSPETP